MPPDLAGVDHADEARPPLVSAGAREVTDALAAGRIIAVPGFGGYSLAVRASQTVTVNFGSRIGGPAEFSGDHLRLIVREA